uniref:Methylmalonyl-CoA mutase C-terminal domain-containing protein n=1 Tax=Candidatus Kentrum sp. LPFa TaxID=2126335 RepID=A0A450WUW2_9GAMM|nr:MAG: methylmalonyl-CoA mutase C-terminal domain-containing protein [Candidatus Kentron sp. LPFa]
MGMGAMFRTPSEMACQSVGNDAHVIGRGAKDPGHKTLLPEFVKELKELDREDIMVVGGIIPAQDCDYYYSTCISTALPLSPDRER